MEREIVKTKKKSWRVKKLSLVTNIRGHFQRIFLIELTLRENHGLGGTFKKQSKGRPKETYSLNKIIY